MKKLIFILTTILLVTACNGSDNRDSDNNNNNTQNPDPKPIAIPKEFLNKLSVKSILFKGYNDSKGSINTISIDTKNSNDCYFYVNSDGTANLKIFDSFYTGKITSSTSVPDKYNNNMGTYTVTFRNNNIKESPSLWIIYNKDYDTGDIIIENISSFMKNDAPNSGYWTNAGSSIRFSRVYKS
ncbi:hypothetical protein CMU85_18015 [Elizabethkingia anophelis]|nr:membrane lipoprotein lipid attachment site-containing protein [Elizabethkingia anophelis]MDV3583399.1 hypothetical protein [Elizabethkingia anophelis]